MQGCCGEHSRDKVMWANVKVCVHYYIPDVEKR